jgi:hypothetical protein
MFQLAGGTGMFSDECKKALQKCGYSPDDFGTHEQVQKKISDAKAVVQEYNDPAASSKVPPPRKPTEHEAMLARCESGHLAEDRMFHAPGKKNRGNPCSNNFPPDGDALGYQSSQAPCMPMQTYGSEGGGKIGSPHWAVGRNEADQKAANPGVVDQATMSANSQANAALAMREGTDAKNDYNKKIRNLDEAGGVSKADRVKEARERRDDAVAMQQASAKELKGQGGTGSKEGSKNDDADKAAKCIEAFRQVMMAEMRRKALDKYGRNYQDTKKAAEQKKAAAAKSMAAAQKQLDSGKKMSPQQKQALEDQKAQARSDLIDAST